MPNTGNSFVQGLAYYVGNPATAAIAAFDVPLGTLVLDTTNGVLYQKTAALGTNTNGYILYRSSTPGAVGATETKFCTTQLDKTSNTTLGDITGLTGFTLTAAGVYKLHAHLLCTATANGGTKLALALTTATLTNADYTTIGFDAAAVASAKATTATSPVPLYGSTTAALSLQVSARFVINAGGTGSLQFAQNASHVDTSSILVGSWATFTRVS